MYTFQSHLFPLLIAPAIAIAALTARVHDDSFTPDEVLRVSRKVIGVGGIQRYTTLVNDSLPGPELRIPEEQVVWIRVYNDMTDANLTMHWHGLAQAASPFSDGSPMASQWPIPPQHYFDYELKSPRGTAGSYYYHSHIDFQTSTANGPLIVEDSGPPPYKTHGERIIYLSEIWNQTDKEISEGLRASPMRWSNDAGAWLINGNAISNYDTVDPSSERLAVVEIDPGNIYRFRFIAATALAYASLAFEHHPGFQIIEADGSYTKPHNTSLLQLGSGQRFSALFQAKTCDELAALGRLDFYIQVESRERPTVVTNYAILRYRNSCKMTGGNSDSSGSSFHVSTTSNPAVAPLELPPTINGFLDYQLEPLYPNDFPSAAQVSRRIFINTQQFADKWYSWKDNDVVWTDDANAPFPHVTPTEPCLVSLYKNQTKYLPDYDAAVSSNGLDPATKTYPARLGEVIEIVFQQLGADRLDGTPPGSLDTHPWHAHGAHFYDVGGGPGPYDPDVAEEHLRGTQPVLRDTTMQFRYEERTGAGQRQGWRAWRLRVENPGVWMIHCHTLQHMLMGMQTVWVFGDAEDIIKVGEPEVSGYLDYGGSVNGNASHPPVVVHFND